MDGWDELDLPSDYDNEGFAAADTASKQQSNADDDVSWFGSDMEGDNPASRPASRPALPQTQPVNAGPSYGNDSSAASKVVAGQHKRSGSLLQATLTSQHLSAQNTANTVAAPQAASHATGTAAHQPTISTSEASSSANSPPQQRNAMSQSPGHQTPFGTPVWAMNRVGSYPRTGSDTGSYAESDIFSGGEGHSGVGAGFDDALAELMAEPLVQAHSITEQQQKEQQQQKEAGSSQASSSRFQQQHAYGETNFATGPSWLQEFQDTIDDSSSKPEVVSYGKYEGRRVTSTQPTAAVQHETGSDVSSTQLAGTVNKLEDVNVDSHAIGTSHAEHFMPIGVFPVTVQQTKPYQQTSSLSELHKRFGSHQSSATSTPKTISSQQPSGFRHAASSSHVQPAGFKQNEVQQQQQRAPLPQAPVAGIQPPSNEKPVLAGQQPPPQPTQPAQTHAQELPSYSKPEPVQSQRVQPVQLHAQQLASYGKPESASSQGRQDSSTTVVNFAAQKLHAAQEASQQAERSLAALFGGNTGAGDDDDFFASEEQPSMSIPTASVQDIVEVTESQTALTVGGSGVPGTFPGYHVSQTAVTAAGFEHATTYQIKSWDFPTSSVMGASDGMDFFDTKDMPREIAHSENTGVASVADNMIAPQQQTYGYGQAAATGRMFEDTAILHAEDMSHIQPLPDLNKPPMNAIAVIGRPGTSDAITIGHYQEAAQPEQEPFNVAPAPQQPDDSIPVEPTTTPNDTAHINTFAVAEPVTAYTTVAWPGSSFAAADDDVAFFDAPPSPTPPQQPHVVASTTASENAPLNGNQQVATTDLGQSHSSQQQPSYAHQEAHDWMQPTPQNHDVAEPMNHTVVGGDLQQQAVNTSSGGGAAYNSQTSFPAIHGHEPHAQYLQMHGQPSGSLQSYPAVYQQPASGSTYTAAAQSSSSYSQQYQQPRHGYGSQQTYEPQHAQLGSQQQQQQSLASQARPQNAQNTAQYPWQLPQPQSQQQTFQNQPQQEPPPQPYPWQQGTPEQSHVQYQNVAQQQQQSQQQQQQPLPLTGLASQLGARKSNPEDFFANLGGAEETEAEDFLQSVADTSGKAAGEELPSVEVTAQQTDAVPAAGHNEHQPDIAAESNTVVDTTQQQTSADVPAAYEDQPASSAVADNMQSDQPNPTQVTAEQSNQSNHIPTDHEGTEQADGVAGQPADVGQDVAATAQDPAAVAAAAHEWAAYYAAYYVQQYGQEHYQDFYNEYYKQYMDSVQASAQQPQQDTIIAAPDQQQQQQQPQVQDTVGTQHGGQQQAMSNTQADNTVSRESSAPQGVTPEGNAASAQTQVGAEAPQANNAADMPTDNANQQPYQQAYGSSNVYSSVLQQQLEDSQQQLHETGTSPWALPSSQAKVDTSLYQQPAVYEWMQQQPPQPQQQQYASQQPYNWMHNQPQQQQQQQYQYDAQLQHAHHSATYDGYYGRQLLDPSQSQSLYSTGSLQTPVYARTNSLSNAGFGGGAFAASGNLYVAQYNAHQKVATPKNLVELPVSHAAARMCPNGRPAAPFVSFGFGGQAVLVHIPVNPDLAKEDTNNNVFPGLGTIPNSTPPLATLTVSAVTALPAALKTVNVSNITTESQPGTARQVMPFSATSVAPQKTASAETLEGMSQLLSSYPGPLSPSTNRDKLGKWIQERASHYSTEDPHAGSAPLSLGVLMWQMLGLQIKHGPLLRLAGPAGRQPRDEVVEQDVLKLLGSLDEPGNMTQGGNKLPGAGGSLPSTPSSLLNSLSFRRGGSRHTEDAMMGGDDTCPLIVSSTDDAAQSAASVAVQKLLVAGKKVEAVKAAASYGLWGVALLLASSCPPPLFAEVAAAMTQASLLPGSPLRTAAMLLSGRPELAVPSVGSINPANPAAMGNTGPPSGPFSPKSGGGRKNSHINQSLAPGLMEGQGTLLSSWRHNLAVLVSCARVPADIDAIVNLGDLLASQGALPRAAQLCYQIAGLPPGFHPVTETDGPGFESPVKSPTVAKLSKNPSKGAVTTRYCLLGVDHMAAPRTCANILAIQRLEILELAFSALSNMPNGAQGDAANNAGLPSAAPYKLVYAHILAEAGRVPDALQYCSTVESFIRENRAMQQGCPPGYLALLLKETEELKERLGTFANAHSINLKNVETSMTKIGRFLDNTLTKLLWGSPADASAATGRQQAELPANNNVSGSNVPTDGPKTYHGGVSVPVAPMTLPGNVSTTPTTQSVGPASLGAPHGSMSKMSRVPSTASIASVTSNVRPPGGLGGTPDGSMHRRQPSYDDGGVTSHGRPPLPPLPPHSVANSGPPSARDWPNTNNYAVPNNGTNYPASPSAMHSGPPSVTNSFPASRSHSRGPSGIPDVQSGGYLGAESAYMPQPNVPNQLHPLSRSSIDTNPNSHLPGVRGVPGQPQQLPPHQLPQHGMYGAYPQQQGMGVMSHSDSSNQLLGHSFGSGPVPGPVMGLSPAVSTTDQQLQAAANKLMDVTDNAASRQSSTGSLSAQPPPGRWSDNQRSSQNPPIEKTKSGRKGWGLFSLLGRGTAGGQDSSTNNNSSSTTSMHGTGAATPAVQTPTAMTAAQPPRQSFGNFQNAAKPPLQPNPYQNPSNNNSTQAATQQQPAPQENTPSDSNFYYDNEKKRWVFPGEEEPPPEPAATSAPPTSFGQPGAGAGAGPPGAVSGSSMGVGNRGTGLRSRYVDTFNSSGAGQTAPSSSKSNILPPQATLASTSAKPTSFFTPGGVSNSAAATAGGSVWGSTNRASKAPQAPQANARDVRGTTPSSQQQQDVAAQQPQQQSSQVMAGVGDVTPSNVGSGSQDGFYADVSNVYQGQNLHQHSRPGSSGGGNVVASSMQQNQGYAPVGSIEQQPAGSVQDMSHQHISGQPVSNNAGSAANRDTGGAAEWGQQPAYASYDALLQGDAGSRQGGYGSQSHSRRVSGSTLYAHAVVAPPTGQQNTSYNIADSSSQYSQHAALSAEHQVSYNQHPGVNTGPTMQQNMQPVGQYGYHVMQQSMQGQPGNQQGFSGYGTGYDGMTDITL